MEQQVPLRPSRSTEYSEIEVPGYYILNILHDSRKTTVFRAKSTLDEKKVVFKALKPKWLTHEPSVR